MLTREAETGSPSLYHTSKPIVSRLYCLISLSLFSRRHTEECVPPILLYKPLPPSYPRISECGSCAAALHNSKESSFQLQPVYVSCGLPLIWTTDPRWRSWCSRLEALVSKDITSDTGRIGWLALSGRRAIQIL